MTENPDADITEDDTLTEYEKLQILAISSILRTGKSVTAVGDHEIVIDYTDR